MTQIVSVTRPRRYAIRLAIAILALLGALASGLSAASRDVPLPADLDGRLNDALAYLASQQQPDGALAGEKERTPVSLTGLGLMAFLSCGHTPDAGKYALTVRSALDYLLKKAPDDGYFGRLDGQMYGHAIVTTALAEVYGMESDVARRKRVRIVLDKAVDVIVKAQQQPKSDAFYTGGWRYEPAGSDTSDLSVTGWCVLALRASQNAGIAVPKETPDVAKAYIQRCYRADQRGFAYLPREDASVAMTGSGALSLYLLDGADLAMVADAVKFVVDTPVGDQTKYYYYSLYYAAQAAHQAGDVAWRTVWRRTYDQLARAQLKEGAFPPSRAGGEPGVVDGGKPYTTYSTAMAVLTLSIPYRLLPIYQR